MSADITDEMLAKIEKLEAERDLLREENEKLRAWLSACVIDPDPLSTDQLAKLRKLVAARGAVEGA